MPLPSGITTARVSALRTTTAVASGPGAGGSDAALYWASFNAFQWANMTAGQWSRFAINRPPEGLVGGNRKTAVENQTINEE